MIDLIALASLDRETEITYVRRERDWLGRALESGREIPGHRPPAAVPVRAAPAERDSKVSQPTPVAGSAPMGGRPGRTEPAGDGGSAAPVVSIVEDRLDRYVGVTARQDGHSGDGGTSGGQTT
jgi:hypothetical protein